MFATGRYTLSLSAWFKSKTADVVLQPVRDQVCDLIENGSRVLEVGCGTGDLLFRLSEKIQFALGLDIDSGMIRFANDRSSKEGISHLEFRSKRLESLDKELLRRFNIATSTLCLHEMTEADAVSVLATLSEHCEKIIIADYAVPSSNWGKLSIELDELISGHYGRFRLYRRKGGVPHLAAEAGLNILSENKTPIDGILIWELG